MFPFLISRGRRSRARPSARRRPQTSCLKVAEVHPDFIFLFSKQYLIFNPI